MTTATVSAPAVKSVSFPCRLLFVDGRLEVTAGTAKPRTLVIASYDDLSISNVDDADLIERLDDMRGRRGDDFHASLSREEMVTLKDMRERQDRDNAPLPSPVVQAAPVPPAVQAPAPVAEESKPGPVSPAPVKPADRKNDVLSDAVAGLASRQATGASSEERKVSGLRKTVEMLSDDLYLLIYDIPTVFNDEVPNPSNIFREHAYRLNLSCWVFPKAALQLCEIKEVLAKWEDLPKKLSTVTIGGKQYKNHAEVEYYTIRFHPSERAQLQAIAQKRLYQAIIEIHESLFANLKAAQERFRKTESALIERELAGGEPATEKEQQAMANRLNGDQRTAIRRALDCYADYAAAAEAFEELEDLSEMFAGVRAAIMAERESFNARMVSQGRKGVDIRE